MFSTSPPSSPPAISLALSFINLLNNSYLSTLWLPYQNIEKLSETLNKRPNQMANYMIMFNLSIALSESLNTNLLAVFDNSNKDIDFGGIDDKLTLEAVANQAFFKKKHLVIFNF